MDPELKVGQSCFSPNIITVEAEAREQLQVGCEEEKRLQPMKT